MDTIVALLNASGLWLVLQLGRMSIELTILAGIVLAALYALRVKSPALRHLFWGLLLAKPVATLLVASPLSLYGFLWPPAPETMFTRPPLPVVMETLPIDQPKPAVAILEMGPVPEATPPAPPFWRNIDRYGLASLCWVIGAGALGLRLLIGCVYVAFLRSTAITQREGLLASLTAEAEKTLRLRRRVRIATTTVCHGPVLAGIIRPVILLPEEMAGSLSARQLKLVITHELAHAKRWDNLVLLIQRLAEMFLFFHPVVWFCGWMMRREAEAACDDMVVAAYGDAEGAGAAAYADSLTRVAEMRCGITRRLLVNTFAAAESNFHQRIRRILDGHPRRMTLGFALAAISALILIGVLGLPTVASKPEASSPVSEIEMKLAKTGTIVFENTHLTEILDFISASVNPLNFVVDWRVVEKPGEAPGVEVSDPKDGPYTVVTDGMVQSIDVRDKPWREVLQALLEPLGLVFDTQPNYVWISSQAMLDTDAKRPGIPERYPNTQILKRLKSPVALEFENIHLRDLLDFFADSYDINMILDDCVIPPLADGKSTCKRPRYVTDGWVPSLKLRDISVDEAIEALLRPMDLIPVVQYNFLLITSDRDMELATELDRHEDKTDSTNPSAETADFTPPNSILFKNPGESILKTLQGRISVEFEDIHIMDILEFMSDSWDINFALDYRAVRPKSLENSSQHGNQAANDGRMPYINLRNLPMQEALESMFLALDLIGVVKTEHVWVTSKEMMAADAKEPAFILQEPSEELQQGLNVPISIEFEDIHVAEVLDFIGDSWDINFMLDHRVIKSGSGSLGETKTPRYISDGHVPYVNLKNVPILEALVALLRPMNLVPVVKTNHVWVTTYEMLDQITENPRANNSITESPETTPFALSGASTTLNPAPEWTAPSGWIAEIAPGQSVELVVCKKQIRDQWWRPDGTPVDESELSGEQYVVKPTTPPDVILDLDHDFDFEKDTGFEFVFNVKKVKIEKFQCDGAIANGFRSPVDFEDAFSVISTYFDPIPSSINMILGLSTENWNLIGDPIPVTQRQPISLSGEYGQVVIAPPKEEDILTYLFNQENPSNEKSLVPSVIFTVTVNGPLGNDFFRVTAIDKEGNPLQPPRHSKSQSVKEVEYTFTFLELTLSELKEFRVETHPKMEVEFKNVSLTPGQHTDYQISILTQETSQETNRNAPLAKRFTNWSAKPSKTNDQMALAQDDPQHASKEDDASPIVTGTMETAPEMASADPGEIPPDRTNMPKYRIEAMVLTGPVATIDAITDQWRPVDNARVLPGETRVFLASDRDGKQVMLDRLKEYPDLELLSAPRVSVLSSEDIAKRGYLAEEVPVAHVGEDGSIRAILKNPAPTEIFEKNIGYYSDSLVAFFRQEKYCSFLLDMTSHPLQSNDEEESTPDYAGIALAAAVHQTADPGVVDLRFYFNRKTVSEPSRGLAFWQPKGQRTSHESPVALKVPVQLGHSLGLLVEDQAPEHKVLALLTIE